MKSTAKLWISGVAGLIIIFLPYAGFTIFVHKMALVLLGITISVVSFWSLSEARIRNENR